MRLDLPVSPLSGADPDDPDDPGNDDPPSQPSPPHTPPPPPVQNVPHGRPHGPWQKKVTFDDCAFLQPYEAERDDFYQPTLLGTDEL